jgi:hypothetical protein
MSEYLACSKTSQERQRPMVICSNPLRSTRKSVETTVVSPVQDIGDGSES